MKIKAFMIAMILSIVAITSYSQVPKQAKLNLTSYQLNTIEHGATNDWELLFNSTVTATPGQISFNIPSLSINQTFNITNIQEVLNDYPKGDVVIGFTTTIPNTFIYTISCPITNDNYIAIYDVDEDFEIIFKIQKPTITNYEQF